MTKYYIENLPIYLKYFDKSTKGLINPIGGNVIDLATDKDKQFLIKAIQDSEFVKDKEFKKFLDESLPVLSKRVTAIPIDVKELKEHFEHVFFELPDEVFEGKNIVEIVTKVVNFVLKKHEISFLIINIETGKLIYDGNYKYKKTYSFYHRMVKINYDLEFLHGVLRNTHSILEMLYVKHVLFGGKEIGRKELNSINEIINFMGKNEGGFKFALDKVEKNVNDERIFIKRTKIPVPNGYFDEENQLLQTISTLKTIIKNQQEEAYERKKVIEREIGKRNGILTFENAKTLFEMFRGMLLK